jgi:hypothetical protein
MTDLQTIKRKRPDSFRYRGKNYIMIHYSQNLKEIIWEAQDHSGQVYMNNDNIELIKY